MKFIIFIGFISFFSCMLYAQNDIDAIRYSNTFFGGTSRSKAMAGSFGALGADGSCMGNNPAGIGLYKKGEMNFSFGLKFNTVTSTHNTTRKQNSKTSVPFDGITLVGAWDDKKNNEFHHAFGIGCNQTVNFNSNITIEGTSNNKSILNDMLATAIGKKPNELSSSFAGMAFNTYLLDTLDGKYYSYVNTKYDVFQSKNNTITGVLNDWSINYALGYKDKLYVGITLGIPTVRYNYSSIYTETDTKDSMRIGYNATTQTFSGTYDYDVYYYPNNGGFKSLSYQEEYRTFGKGYNLKLGVIYRLTDFMRVGGSFHSSTIYNLTDTYIYRMSSTFDNGGKYSTEDPISPGGRFEYKIITPMKLTGSIAFLIKKHGAINIDYDVINYKKASIRSNPQEFDGVNQTIKNKYGQTSNVRIGGEANLKPVFIRLGYAMFGSPFGAVFSGDFVKTFYTGGIGFRRDNWCFDLSFTKSSSKENYYLYNPNYVDKSRLLNSGTTIAVTIGSKF